jgi:hypothetical protein
MIITNFWDFARLEQQETERREIMMPLEVAALMLEERCGRRLGSCCRIE